MRQAHDNQEGAVKRPAAEEPPRGPHVTSSGPQRVGQDGAVRRGRGSSAEEEAQLPWTRRRSGASWGDIDRSVVLWEVSASFHDTPRVGRS